MVGLKGETTQGPPMGHLADINKSYFGHLVGAWKMAFWFALGSLRLIIHGILPNIDEHAGQRTVDRYSSPQQLQD